MAGLKDNMPHAGFDADEDDFARTPPTPVSPAALREVLEQHGDRFEPILAVLRDQPWKELVTSRDLMDSLSAQGLEQSERTLRLHLAEMAEAGLIQRHGRRGYRLTEAGTEVTRELTVSRRIGSILYRMEETACQLTFDLSRRQGLVSINAYVIPQTLLGTLIDEVESVFKAGLAVGQRVLFALPGDDILGREVPEGHIGLGTMCSLTLASMLMRRGVPTHAIFGGLLHVINGKPEHFLEMIRYDATSLSPNEVFIRANLTSVSAAAKRGVGAITASFRELPMSVLPAARTVMKECEQAEFPGIMCIGRPGQQLLNIPVHEGRVGMILSTGLNPLASLWEHDRSAPNRGMPGLLLESSRPMVGPAPYEQLISYQEFCTRAAAFIATQQRISPPHISQSTTSSILNP